MYILNIFPCAEPEEVSLKVDGETDQCSRAEDINFEIIGFSIYGQVRVVVRTLYNIV